MSDIGQRNRESLSALMDNEVPELELRRALKAVSQDQSLSDSWHRYQLAAAAMRRELPPRMTDLSSRISAAIDSEKSLKPSLSRFIQPFSKVAIAASVAVVAVVGVRQFQQPLGTAPGVAPQTATVAAAEQQPLSTGPQFQLPAGYELPPVSARTVSTGRPMVSDPRPVVVFKQSQPQWVGQPAVQDYLNRFMEQHTDRAVFSAGQGVMPYARLPQEVPDVR